MFTYVAVRRIPWAEAGVVAQPETKHVDWRGRNQLQARPSWLQSSGGGCSMYSV